MVLNEDCHGIEHFLDEREIALDATVQKAESRIFQKEYVPSTKVVHLFHLMVGGEDYRAGDSVNY